MPTETFTYDWTLTTWLDYARFRLADTDEDDPYLWNETYASLYNAFGPVGALVIAAGQIALRISQRVTSFGEAAGIRFTKANADYYETLPDILRGEPPFSPGTVRKFVLSGKIRTKGVWNPIGTPCWQEFVNQVLDEQRAALVLAESES